MPKSELKVVEAPEDRDVNSIAQALAAPFDAAEVKFKPQTVSGNRALAIPFVDARVIQDRLDDVLGVMGWQDSYKCLPDGSVVCRLRIRIGGEWIAKTDVGGQSEQPDERDRRKAAFSDALKRAAVKFGIGRYLYRLKPQWVDYDTQKRQFARPPVLSGGKTGTPVPSPSAHRSHHPHPPHIPAESAKPQAQAETLVPAETSKAAARGIPANGPELQRRLYDHDERLANQGLCKPGDLVKAIVDAGRKAGYEKDLSAWSGPAIQLAIDETRAFETRLREPAKKEVA
jgi:hypothetical protein